MERLDKIIGRETGYSRKDIKILVKNKRIKVNDEIVLKSDIKISEEDIIKLDDNVKSMIHEFANELATGEATKADLITRTCKICKNVYKWTRTY